jgi:hypothetical protein
MMPSLLFVALIDDRTDFSAELFPQAPHNRFLLGAGPAASIGCG